MRNLKKILALALVFAMTFTFASAASFSDQGSIDVAYVDDVNMLVELGVISGYPDGTFGPEKNITRAEFAKMAYTLKNGADSDGNLFASQTNPFVDVAADHWAKGFINYCYTQKIVAGVGNGKFNPNGNITVAEATKMILVILGCNPEKEGFVGASWQSNVVSKAIDLGVFDGWSGDPTQLATRQLVAKLMRNAIFSPVYDYSAITGVGSQMDALGQNYNQTLGEKTMGLFHVEGIVVANERYALSTDNEGVEIDVDATADDETSVIYYVTKDLNGDEYQNLIEIDRPASDDMLGAMVDVYFTADAAKDANGFISGYKNIEVMGNVIVKADTVVYEVGAAGLKVLPNEDYKGSDIIPYIQFETEDGSKVQVKADKKIASKLGKGDDAQTDADAIKAFNSIGYVFDTDVNSEDGTLSYCADTADANILADMSTKTLAKYRFVSVDGGKTYSYIFQVVADDDTSLVYGAVTSYSESKGTISLTQVGTLDLEDCIIKGEVAVDDTVVFYRDNGKIVVEKVEAITGAVESYTDEGVVIGGNEYFAWEGCEEINGDIFQYYRDNKSAAGANTTYYVYNGLIMEVFADETVSAVEDYAVILRSYYDADEDVAYVKLGFGDNSEGTYRVGKTYLSNSRKPNDEANIYNRAKDFASNKHFGIVVKYKVRDDGTLDLSAQNFKDIFTAGNTTTKYHPAATSAGVEEGKIVVTGEGSYFGYNENTIIFALYGNPCYSLASDGQAKPNAADNDFEAVKARAYKLTELVDMTANAIDGLYVGPQNHTTPVVSYVLNSKTSNSKYVVCAAMTIGKTLAAGNISYKESSALAYVVSARQYYNNATDSYYAQLTLINEEGLFTAKTVDNVTDLNAVEVLKDGYIGNIGDSKNDEDNVFPVGSFVRYDMNAEGVITTIDNDGCSIEDIKTTYVDGANQGYYLVNVSGERNGYLSFYNTDADIELDTATAFSCELHEDGYSIIGIDDDAYVGETLAKISGRTESLEKNIGNAIIEIDEGMVLRIFSFISGYDFN